MKTINKTTGFFLIVLLVVISACAPKITTVRNVKGIFPITVDSMVKVKEVEKVKPADEYYQADYLRNEDFVYDTNIHTVLLYKTGWILSQPIIKLNSDETLDFSFDDFDTDVKRYKYTFLQCDARWQPSMLQQMHYIDGFMDDYIDEYKASFNTIQKYEHYSMTFPKQTVKITKSGNYILKVYVEGKEQQPVITRRFMVLEQKLDIKGKIRDATMLQDRKYKQEVDFTLLAGDYQITNPSQNLTVILYQNGRQDNAIRNLKPHLVKGSEFIYDYQEENVFNGGNEFRQFDIKSLRYNSERIYRFGFDNHYDHVYLLPDFPRPFKFYKNEEDIDGKKAIHADDVKDIDIESDYAMVHFTMPYEAPLTDGNLYIMGALTDWQFTKEAQLKYNYQDHNYETTLLLKQGYYNYQYVFLKNGEKIGDETFIEGNHSETENDYFIFVYNRESGELYDKLIGYHQLNSIANRQ